jgi:predicted ATP-dependent endonuclease of OLD family
MRLSSFRISNFRRLKDVTIDLDMGASIFVGANNSGKTSATQIFQSFLGSSQERFSVHDFSADCWAIFDKIGLDSLSSEPLPTIGLDLWFEVAESDLHRVVFLLPTLDWQDEPLGVRLLFAPKDRNALLENFRQANNSARSFAEKSSESGCNAPQKLDRWLRAYPDNPEQRYVMIPRTK